jgi:hypothetical protein
MQRKYHKSLSGVFLRQRRNFIGISTFLAIYYWLGGSIKKLPTIAGAIELENAKNIEILFWIFLLYSMWRYLLYRRLESSKYIDDLADCLSYDNKFMEFIKPYFVKSYNGNALKLNKDTHLFITSFGFKVTFSLRSYILEKKDKNGNLTVQKGDAWSLKDQVEYENNHYGSRQYLSTEIPLMNLLQFLPKSILKTIIAYPGFSDFILPWILCFGAVASFIFS